MRDIDGTAAVATGCGSATGFFADFIHDWEEMRKKFDDHEITKEEGEERKRACGNGTWVKIENDKSLCAGK